MGESWSQTVGSVESVVELWSRSARAACSRVGRGDGGPLQEPVHLAAQVTRSYPRGRARGPAAAFPAGGATVHPRQAGRPMKYAGVDGESVGGLVDSSSGARGGWLK